MSAALEEAAVNADLGLPVPRATRFYAVKRLFARASWLFLRQQVRVNRALIAEASELHCRLEDLRAEVADLSGGLESVAAKLAIVDRQAIVRTADHVDLVRRELDTLWERVLQADERLGELGRSQVVLRSALTSGPGWRGRRPDDGGSAVGGAGADSHSERIGGVPTSHLEEVFAAVGRFDEVFRGPTAEISGRLEPYLRDLTDAGVREAERVVDLGSGRGEWLALLEKAGFLATGVESRAELAEECRERGLDVVTADALDYLSRAPAGSIAAISAFHFVEHLDLSTLVSLLELALRALRPGGLLLLETANPENVLVGASHFYYDPTHTRPIPPRLLTFLVEQAGFDGAAVRELHPIGSLPAPAGEGDQRALEAVVELLNRHLLGPQDYAVLARR